MQQNEHTCLHLTESLGGGVLTAIKAICDAQASIGYATKLVYLERPDTPSNSQLMELFPNSQILNLGTSNFLGNWKLISYSWNLLRNLKPHQIIHVHSTIAGVITRIPNLIFKKRIYYTPHCFAFQRKDIGQCRRKLYRLIEGYLSCFTPTVVLGCSDAETRMAREIGAKMSKYLGNFVEVPAIEYSKESQVSDLQVRVGTVGRVTKQKNLPRYIELIQNLEDPIRLHWVGGNEKSEINLDNGSSIEFSGWLSPQATRAELEKLDIFLLLSDWEGLPFVALEAMALGKPVILWNFDSAVELVPNELVGYVVKSVEEALLAISELLSSPKKRMQMGIAGNKLVRDKFNVTLLPKLIPSIYDCCSDG